MKHEDFVKATEFTYKLYLQDCLSDPKSSVPALTLEQLVESDLSYEKSNYKVAVNRIEFKRKVYKPGEIKAEIMLTLQGKSSDTTTIMTPDNLKSLFLHRRVKLTIRPKDAKNETVMAENYYIHEISPLVKKDSVQTQMFVTLFIYSLDKLMTINKYSKAYVVKKLGSEILCAESKLFGYEGVPLVPVAVDNIQHLRYQQSAMIDKKTVNIPSEFIQPYLVQYNETFYDFMARTANRCGEFLLFENGKLTLGLPKADSELTNIANYTTITYQNFVTSPLEIENYTRDSVGKKEGKLNNSNVDKGDNGYPEGTFGEDLSYNAELAHDDFIFPLFKDKFSSFASALGMGDSEEAKSKILLDVFSEVVGNTDDGWASVPSIIKNLAIGYSKSLMDARRTCDKINAGGNKSWIDGYKDIVEQSNGTKTIPFSTLSDSGWLDLTYYSRIRKYEELQQQNMVCVDMGTNCLPVKVGEIVTIDRLAGTYVVTEVKQGCILKKKDDQEVADQTQQIVAIPTIEVDGARSNVYPPVIDAPVIRRSGPQTAFVVDNGDPKGQGRVRIAFPWQAVGTKALVKETESAKQQCEAQQKVVDGTEKKLEKLKDEFHVKQTCKTEFVALDVALKNEPDKAKQRKLVNKRLAEVQAQKDANDSRIEEINAELEKADPKALTAEQKALKEEKAALEKKNRELGNVVSDLGSLASSNSIVDELKKKEKSNEQEQEQINKDIVKTEKELGEAKLELKNAEATVKKLKEKFDDQLKAVASPWVRVASPMATGDNAGVLFTPLVGDEVLVNFDNDNVERPYVVGSLYSKENTTPDDKMVIKSSSGQKLAFSPAGSGWKFIEGLSPLFKTVCGYLPKGPKGLDDNARKLAGEITMSDEYGMFEVAMSSHKRAVSVSSPFGKVSVSAFTGINISAPNGDVKIEGKNVTIAAGNNIKLLSGTNVDNDEFSWKDFFKDAAVDVVDTFAPGLVGMKLVDVKLIRCVTDVFLRPIEGTLCVKSKNYLMLEAGKGKANVNVERYTEAWQKHKKMEPDADKQMFFAKTVAYVNRINQKVTLFCKDYQKLKQDALDKKAAYEANLAYMWKDGSEKPKFMVDAFKLGDGEFKKNDTSFAGGTIDMSVVKVENLKPFSANKPLPLPHYGLGIAVDDFKKFIMPSGEAFAEAVYKLQKKTRDFSQCFSDDTVKVVNQAVVGSKSHKETKWIDTIFKEVLFKDDSSLQQKTLKAWEDRFGGATEEPKAPFLGESALHDNDDVFDNPQRLSRKMVAHLLLKLYKAKENEMVPATPATNAVYGKLFALGYKEEADITDELLTTKWDDVVALGPKEAEGKLASVLKNLKKFAGFLKIDSFWKPVVDPSAPKMGWDRQVWNDESGKIIFSDTKNATYGFKGEKIEKWSQAGLSNADTLKKALTDI